MPRTWRRIEQAAQAALPEGRPVDMRHAPRTRIQKRNTEAILDAALEVFSSQGFAGATLDRIAEAAGLSKPNLLYYFPSKEAIHRALISETLDTWLAPLRDLTDDGDPVDEIVAYALRKLDMARELPRESRFFAHEIVQGAPRILDIIEGPLKDLVDEKARLIAGWAASGRIAPVDPHHLIFSIWATTQHYADFDVQVRGILRPEGDAHFEGAATFLDTLYRRLLTPRG
jgi:TetR/AcrR family transcriptional regulator